MSALGHKRTSEHVQSMSALPPKADIRPAPQKCYIDFGAGPVCSPSHLTTTAEVLLRADHPQKRTLELSRAMRNTKRGDRLATVFLCGVLPLALAG